MLALCVGIKIGGLLIALLGIYPKQRGSSRILAIKNV
jgi:hypothetical protein